MPPVAQGSQLPFFAQILVYAFCRGHPSPLPATCIGCKSLNDIYFLYILHYPPLSCVLILMVLVSGGIYSALILVWFQFMTIVFESMGMCPKGFSMASFFQSVAFTDWLCAPGHNKKGGKHVDFADSVVYVHLQKKIIYTMMTKWCPNLITIRSHGAMPEHYHNFVLHPLLAEKGGTNLTRKSDPRRHSHPQSLSMGHRKRVQFDLKKRNVHSLLWDVHCWHSRTFGGSVMSVTMDSLSDMLDANTLNMIYTGCTPEQMCCTILKWEPGMAGGKLSSLLT